jgi:hypothetical protein
MDRDRGNTIFVRFCVTRRIHLLYRKSVFEHAKGLENRRPNSVAYKKISLRVSFVYRGVDVKVSENKVYRLDFLNNRSIIIL